MGIIKYLKPYIGFIFIAVVLLYIQARCDLALPEYMADIINTGIISGNNNYILETGSTMLAVSLVGAIASITVGYFAALTAAGVARDLRRNIFKKVSGFTGAEFDQFSTASLITRSTNDVTQIQTVLVLMIRMMFYAPILGVGGVIKAINSSPSMSWIIGIAVISLLGIIGILFSIVMPRFKRIQSLVDRLNLVARENIEGMPVIRAFNTQTFELERFDRANRDLTDINLFVNRVMTIMMPAMMLIMNMVTVVIVWVGAKQVSALQMNLGDMMAYMQYAMQIIMSFLMMSMMFIMVPRAAVSADRISEVLDTEPDIVDPEHPSAFSEPFEPIIEFRDVCFTYPGGQEDVLHHISFVAPAGKTTAIIGSTGSGKSTLLNLMLRFYDVRSGEVRVGGQDVRQVSRKALRDHIGYVPQKSMLFSGTIHSNLAYGRADASDAEIHQAAEIAQAMEFISEKAEGFETEIAQGGTNVSGGQKQRMSIGRACIKDAPILMFDDSFSALDLKTDRRLRGALQAHYADKTIILVAQRVSSIMHAEQIIVLDNGCVVGAGTHTALLETCEVYQEIARSQLSDEELAYA